MQQGHLRVAWGPGWMPRDRLRHTRAPQHSLSTTASASHAVLGAGWLALAAGLGRQPGESPPQAARGVRGDAAETAIWTCRATLEFADQPATAGSLTDEHGTVGLGGGRVEAGWRQGGGRVEVGWRLEGGETRTQGHEPEHHRSTSWAATRRWLVGRWLVGRGSRGGG
jgi:hypothetical protein